MGSITKHYTFFSKTAGLEIRLGFIEKEGIKTGKVFLRSFSLEPGSKDKQISVMLTSEEAFSFTLFARKVLKEKKNQKVIVHKSKNGSGEYTTGVSLDYWERNGRNGFGITVQRYSQGVNVNTPVSLTKAGFYFLVEILKRWSVDACFTIAE